jgi:hypothetical protein
MYLLGFTILVEIILYMKNKRMEKMVSCTWYQNKLKVILKNFVAHSDMATCFGLRFA